MRFSERIKLLRNVFSVSQSQLAEAIGVKQYYIAKWESGKYDPNPSLKEKVANYFHVSPLWLGGENVHIFTGIVFIPRIFMLPQKRTDLSLQRKITEFICNDGAKHFLSIVNTDRKPDGMVVFKRDDNLLLFLPYISFLQSPDRWSLENDLGGILLPCSEMEEERVQSFRMLSVLSENLYKINSGTSIEDIENILKITIPKRLKEIHKSSFFKIAETEKFEWLFDAKIKIGGDKIPASRAREIIMEIEEKFNNQHEDQKIFFIELKVKK